MQTFYVAETALLEGERYIVNKFKGDWIDGAIRDVNNRILPSNTGTNWDGDMIEVNYNDGSNFFDTDTENAKLCWNSFKDPNRENFQIITAHSNNFGEFFKDSLSPSDIEDLDVNIDELKKYYYEYFISNIGSAPYRGRGSSVKKTAGDDSTNGIAYRIYGCGIYINDVDDINTKKFIVPMESDIILPK